MRRPDPVPRWVRTALFIPGQRSDFLAKAASRGADALIIDLEDAVSEPGKTSARDGARSWLSGHTSAGPLAMARVNALDTAALDADLDALVCEQLHAVLLPKVRTADDVADLADRLTWLEGQRGLPRGHVRIWPIIETAAAIENVERIARASSRIAYLGGGTSEQGDLAREIGFEWTVTGLETLYIRSRVLVAARAAGVPNPMSGLVSGLAGVDDVASFARGAKQLGYSGMMVIHPAHVAVANDVFTPTEAALEDARRVISALEDAADSGIGAVEHEGRMIDVAMARTAAQFMADAARIDGSRGDDE